MKKRRIIFIQLLLVAASISALSVNRINGRHGEAPGRSSADVVEAKTSGVTIVAAGDAMAHMAVLRCARRNDRGSGNNDGFNYLYERLKPFIAEADIATVNAEFPAPKKLRNGRVQYVFGAPEGMVKALAWAGFDVANLANNHAFDQRVAGVAETVEIFEEAGLETVGTGRDAAEAERVAVIERKGIKFAFIGASRILNRRGNSDDPSRPRVNYFEIDRMDEWIREAAKSADVVVVHVHWGSEGQRYAAQREKNDAIRMMEAGADLVIGHHPHVLQPVMEYDAGDGRRCVAAMSMGNFISNQRPGYRYGSSSPHYGDPRDGALLYVTFEKTGDKVKLVSWDALPLWTWNDRLDPDNRVKYPWNIQVWAIPEAVGRINAELASGKLSPLKKRYLLGLREDLIRRSENILSHLGVPRPVSAKIY